MTRGYSLPPYTKRFRTDTSLPYPKHPAFHEPSIDTCPYQSHLRSSTINTRPCYDPLQLSPSIRISAQMIESPSDRRRFLTLPAVQPCGAVSPATLLNSLIVLCREIDGFRSETFHAHGRIVREAVREVGVLQTFLEDVLEVGSPLSCSVVLGFSELHIALQKFRHLLHDFSRPGSRLWILMMSGRVSSELGILVRSIATALDVLPLGSIDSTADVKELIQLLASQASTVKIETDPYDVLTLKLVQSILAKFEIGVAQAPEEILRVFRHLHIETWSQCNEEYLFLQEELSASREEDDDAALLSSLMGFAAYSRATLFDSMDGKRGKQIGSKSEGNPFAPLSSEDLRCPISLEIMTDPVTVLTGQTYDRPSIERWLKSGHVTCPVTGHKLTKKETIPNSVIRKIVSQFSSSSDDNNKPSNNRHRSREQAKTLSPNSPAGTGAIKATAAFLAHKLYTGTKGEKEKAAYEIRCLTKSSLLNRDSFVEAGSVPWLLFLLYSSDPSTQEHAVAALLNLSKQRKGQTAIRESGGFSLIVDVMEEGMKIESQQNTAAILFYISLSEQYRKEIGSIPEAFPALVRLLRRGTYRGKKNAVMALFGLLLFPGNHRKALAADAVGALSGLLSDEHDDLVNDCVAVFAKLAEGSEGSKVMLRSSPVVPQLVEVLRSTLSRSGREHCVSALLSLCTNGGEEVVRLLDEMPFLMPSLYSLVTDGSPQGGKKARSLLNHIHRVHEQICDAM